MSMRVRNKSAARTIKLSAAARTGSLFSPKKDGSWSLERASGIAPDLSGTESEMETYAADMRKDEASRSTKSQSNPIPHTTAYTDEVVDKDKTRFTISEAIAMIEALQSGEIIKDSTGKSFQMKKVDEIS